MSFDDNHRNQDRERGAYTPPTDDDDLPFRRNAFDPRQERGYATGARKAPPSRTAALLAQLPNHAANAPHFSREQQELFNHV